MSENERSEDYSDTFEACSSGRSSFNWEEQEKHNTNPPKQWNKVKVMKYSLKVPYSLKLPVVAFDPFFGRQIKLIPSWK